MKYFWILTFLLFSMLALAQNEYLPVGAEWYYGYRENPLSSPAFGYAKFVISNDTIINDRLCQVMNRKLVASNLSEKNLENEYLAVGGDRIYRYVKDDFVVLYDFSLSANDTFQTRLYRSGEIDTLISVVVDSVSSYEYEGGTLKMFYYRSLLDYQLKSWRFDGWVIERIGNLDSFFPYSEMDCDAAYCFQPLRCFNDFELNYHAGILNCDEVFTNVNDVLNDYQLIYNPSSHLIKVMNQLPIDPLTNVQLYHISGRRIDIDCSFYGSSIEIDIKNVQSGIYLLHVGSMQKHFKIIK